MNILIMIFSHNKNWRVRYSAVLYALGSVWFNVMHSQMVDFLICCQIIWFFYYFALKTQKKTIWFFRKNKAIVSQNR